MGEAEGNTRDPFTFLVGGQAGQGVKKAGSVVARYLAKSGRHAFELDDYQSLIRGGHNFSVITGSARPVTSHYMKADLMVNLDAHSQKLHGNDVAEGGAVVFNSDALKEGRGTGIPFTTEAKRYPKPDLMPGVGAVAVFAAAAGLDRESLLELVRAEYSRGAGDNAEYASTIYELAASELGGRFYLPEAAEQTPRPFISGNQAIALGAVAGGLDLYAGYPMTPSSSILHYLAANAERFGVTVVHPENEVAVANLAVGATFAGARAMAGSSGGGFALMVEAMSLAGMAEAPVVFVLSQRPGPGTGVPTYTAQADLSFALGQGHGEFPRIVASPGSVEEAYLLSARLLELAWRYQTPAILLTEKHLSESSMTVDLDVDGAGWAEPLSHESGDYGRYAWTPDGVSPLTFPPSQHLIKWSSYEHDELGITTEEADAIRGMHDKRRLKGETLVRDLKERTTVNTHGEGGPVIVTWGSTTMSVLEALVHGGIDAMVVQPVFLEPFPDWEFEALRGEEVVVVEQSSTGVFARLVRERTGVEIRHVIKRYDGRPFDPENLAERLREVL
jgi:2-oxoglutarate ferredoxin oxidoreductase subunit alpha